MSAITMKNYPAVRNLTRRMSKELHDRIGGYVEITAPHYRPGAVLGSFVKPGSKEDTKATPQAFNEFKRLGKEVAASLKFDARLDEVIEMSPSKPVLTPLVYKHTIASAAGAKTFTVTSAFKFVLAYPEFPVNELRTILTTREPKAKLRDYVLHYTALGFLVNRNEKLTNMFADLRFPLRCETIDGFGALPLATITAPLRSQLAPDEVLLEVCEMAGTDTAEELVDLAAGFGATGDPVGEWYAGLSASASV